MVGGGPELVRIAGAGEAGDAGEEQHVTVPGELGNGDVEGIAAARVGWPFEDAADAVPARARFRAEELLAARV